MIGKQYTYKGYDFTSGTQMANKASLGYAIILNQEDHRTVLRSDQISFANSHGGFSSQALADVRRFDFEGFIYAANKDDLYKGFDQLCTIIRPEPILGQYGRGFYDLTWDAYGNERTVKAMVLEAPQITDTECNNVKFSFSLLAETETIYSSTTNTETGGLGLTSGFTLATTFPLTTSGYAGAITCNNAGNWKTPLKVEVVGSVTNLRIQNKTNGMQVGWDTTVSNFVYDNRNINNLQSTPIIMTDNGQNIRSKLVYGLELYLTEGDNDIVVSGVGDANVTITRRDGFSY